ncbi:UDP-N-acetylmuramoyl-L-alanine--D-glutamate ligase [Opitutaceae bacterium TAV4]|nr:UDP-N-acetylmuramoyl-L-alanine--D-glutamate ligase [Opitutaceae bacterium TAV4]RRJ99717.1 UDP-N-acetylmuramoyl-L-alanine--D-glutamate ligase [Opitutaceae bacterium TAV3]
MHTRIPPFLKPLLENHPVAVLGAGVSGRAVCDLLTRLNATFTLYDENNPSSSDFSPSAFNLVIFSPGFPPGHPWLAAARAAGCVCLGEVDFASLFWRGSLLAITGTNGKTTLTEFLTHALRHIGRDVTATGNIGSPLSHLVAERGGGGPESIAVCEISSFQAETLNHLRADSAIWTNFAEDHLERHPTIEEYFHAKWRLFERCIGGHVYAGTSVQVWADRLGQTLPTDARIPTEDQPGDILLRGTPFADYPQRENFLLAAAWWHGQGLREGALYAAARTFTLADHRLQKIATTPGNAEPQLGSVTWWNDSKATNFHAVEAALNAFTSPVIVILGGKPKGGDIPAFVRRITPKVRHALLIGETGPVLAAAARDAGLAHTHSVTLDQAVTDAAALARPGEHVLLSPGFASFDQFRGYADRGLRFVQFVNKLGATPVSTT